MFLRCLHVFFDTLVRYDYFPVIPRRILLVGLGGLAVILLVRQVPFSRFATPAGEVIVTEPVETSFSFSAEQYRAMAERSYTALDAVFSPGDTGEQQGIPSSVMYDKLYMTIINDHRLRCCMSGDHPPSSSGEGELGADIDSGIRNCTEDERYGGPFRREEAESAEIVFTFLANRRPVSLNLRDLSKQVELGIHGLELVYGDRRAFFKESVPISENYTLERTLERLCKKMGK